MWPVVLLLWIVTAALTFFFLACGVAATTMNALTAFHWAWAGIAYHAAFFTWINPAAWIFAVGFLAQALACIWFGVIRRRLVFDQGKTPRHLLAAMFMVYSLAYPLLVFAAGHEFPRAPVFGVPCPTALFTAGVLLSAAPPVPRSVFLVPIVWSLVGGSAAWLLGITPDLMLFAAAACLLVYAAAPGLLARPRQA